MGAGSRCINACDSSSVQTVRGCPKHCSFCSVWRTDGQEPRQRGVDLVKAARSANPGATVAMMSSMGVDDLRECTRRQGRIPLLPKPFTAPLLHPFLHDALDLPGMRVAHVAPLI